MNVTFSQVITITMTNFDVSRILVDISSWDIMYAQLFEKLGLNRENLSSDKESACKPLMEWSHVLGFDPIYKFVGYFY